MKRGRFVWVGVLAVCVLSAGCAMRVRTDKVAPEPEVVELPPVTPEQPPAVAVTPDEDTVVALVDEELPVARPDTADTEVRPLTEEEKAIFRTVYFDFDRYEILPPARVILEGVARHLKENPAVNIVIEGHCCDIGTEEYNMALGERRALATRRYLVTLGVAAGRMSTISFGEERPADPRPVDEARRLNRRCEFKIAGR